MAPNSAVVRTMFKLDPEQDVCFEDFHTDLLITQLAMEELSKDPSSIGQAEADIAASISTESGVRQRIVEPTSSAALVEDSNFAVGDEDTRSKRGVEEGTKDQEKELDPERHSGSLDGAVMKPVIDVEGSNLPVRMHYRSDSTQTDTSSTSLVVSSRRMLLHRWSLSLECTSCFEKYSKWKCVAAPCSHIYCRGCMLSLVEACIQDESLYPVTCCKQPLPKTQLRGVLSRRRRAAFELKCREFSTSPGSRIYCCNPKCSIFLGSSADKLRDIVCGTCRTSTCPSCKQRSHPDDTCQENAETLKVYELAQRQKWQTCPGCKAIVELGEGCPHMTCRCRTEFCYRCGGKWKKCHCLQLRGERALVVDFPHIAENDVGQNVARAEPRVLKNILLGWIRRLRLRS